MGAVWGLVGGLIDSAAKGIKNAVSARDARFSLWKVIRVTISD